MLPFQRSAKFKFPLLESTFPTAQRSVDELQVTSEGEPCPDGVVTGVHCEPFQWSARLFVPAENVPTPTFPTAAQQSRADEQSTP